MSCDLFYDDFETGDLSLWDTNVGCAVISTSTYDGIYSADLKDTGDYLIKAHTGVLEIWADFYWKPSSNWTGTAFSSLNFRCGGNELITIGMYASNSRIYAYRATTKLADNGSSILTSDWQHIQIYVYQDVTNGRVVVKHEGVTVIDFTGDTHSNSGSFDSVRMGKCITFTNLYGVCYIDNFCLSSTGWSGATTTTTTSSSSSTTTSSSSSSTTTTTTTEPFQHLVFSVSGA